MTLYSGFPVDELSEGKQTEEVCALHGPLTNYLTAIKADTKWILRLGYVAASVVGASVVVMITVLFPYFAGINLEITKIKENVAILNSKVIELQGSDIRSETDRANMHRAIEELQKKVGR